MEVPGMDEVKKTENYTTSASAFVEGGIQEACDDACSICLEAFCDRDPSTVTLCKHEFHLQCILEWCQRSSNCPMCWQSISLKDPDRNFLIYASQELLEAVERERDIRLTPTRNTTIFHHPTLGDFELQHLQDLAAAAIRRTHQIVGVNDPELESRIIQDLAAAAANRRANRIARREGSNGRPQFVIFSANPSASSAANPISTSAAPAGVETQSPVATLSDSSHALMSSSVQSSQISAALSGSPTSRQTMANANRSYISESLSPNLDNAGPSELQSFSDTWKSRLSAMSMKYKDSISKSTRGLKEKLFSRNSSMADIGSEVRREVNAGIATLSRMMERLETKDGNGDIPRSSGNTNAASFSASSS
ncbi:RING finger protein [Striga asiatica]|uniref:RING-type E3 ubiquitin transferase n=1 Tax=Striga asiatica TaxID=4170 RepID=A0A5A7QA43_STRAF|nr:RING finger protein [Striga asiatica]